MLRQSNQSAKQWKLKSTRGQGPSSSVPLTRTSTHSKPFSVIIFIILSSFLSEASFRSEKGTRKHTKTHTPQYTDFGRSAVSLQACPVSSPHTATSCDIYLFYLYKQNSALLPIDHTNTSVTPVIHTLLYPQTKHLLFSSTSAYFNNFSRHGNTQRMTSGQIIKVTGQCVCQLRRVNPAALNHASNFNWITVLYFYCSPCWMTFKRSTYSSF